LNEERQQKATIRSLFTRIAAKYDLLNRLMSLGQDQRWRRDALALAKLGELSGTSRLLDVATGTGDMALTAWDRAQPLEVVGIDLTPAMVVLAKEKAGDKPIRWTVGDGLALPFPDSAFDAVTSAFMMRNVPDVRQAFQEQRRVVRPEGRVVCLEMTWPQRFPMSVLFQWYFFGWTPWLGGMISGEREAYQYLPRSVKRFFTPEEMAQQMESVGLRDVSWQQRMMGTVIIHVGVK